MYGYFVRETAPYRQLVEVLALRAEAIPGFLGVGVPLDPRQIVKLDRRVDIQTSLRAVREDPSRAPRPLLRGRGPPHDDRQATAALSRRLTVRGT